jgi:hypothetical protein
MKTSPSNLRRLAPLYLARLIGISPTARIFSFIFISLVILYLHMFWIGTSGILVIWGDLKFQFLVGSFREE